MYHNGIDYTAQRLIKENLNNKGYWKQYIVCLIAARGYMTMKAAWTAFKVWLMDIQDQINKKDSQIWSVDDYNSAMKSIINF
jgi:hypothetical protein